jgi:hypothetical protein
LKAHVRTGCAIGPITHLSTLDYPGLAADPDFDAYLTRLADADMSALCPREQLALWINAYNALCAGMIVRRLRGDAARDRAAPASPPPPKLKSILELKRDGVPVWSQTAGVVGGESLSLDEIEHGRLRKAWAEPAVHACIVCASASCPNLRAEAFVGDRLEEQMQAQVDDWLSNPTKGFALCGPRRVQLSRILLWFEDDFAIAGGAKAFVRASAGALPLGAADALDGGRTAVRYFVYDWTLNQTP